MIRLPRPLGTTYLSKQLQKDYTVENKKKLRKAILLAFIQQRLFKTYETNTSLVPKNESLKTLSSRTNKKQGNNIRNNTKRETISISTILNITIEDMCIGLGLSVFKGSMLIDKIVTREAKKAMMNKGYNEMNEIATRVHLNGLIKKSLHKGLIHEAWTGELMAVARINGYHALQVKEANSALSNDIGYTKLTLDLLKAAMPSTPKVAVQINNSGTGNEPDTSEQGMLLTTTMAVKILEEKGYTQMALDLGTLAELHGLNNPGLPDIKALPGDAQGVKSFDVKDLQFTKHDERRAEELGVVPNIDGVPIKAKKARKDKAPITINI